MLRSGARWRDLPERFPSPSTCWRRLVDWETEDVLVRIWQAFLDTLNDQRGIRSRSFGMTRTLSVEFAQRRKYALDSRKSGRTADRRQVI